MFKLAPLAFALAVLAEASVAQTNSVHFSSDNLVTDPNGVVSFRNKYHIFYQYFNLQNSTRDVLFFQRVNWGHATSEDLLSWQSHGTVVQGYVDQEPTFFKGKLVTNVSVTVPFSGSAIVDDKNVTGLMKAKDEPVLLIYTSMSKFLFGVIDPIINADFILSTVTMFYSHDGYNFRKYDRPIIDRSETIRNFRDPTIFKYREDHFNLIMVENMQYAIHASNDLLNWRKVSNFKFDNLPSDVVELETPNLMMVGNTSFLIYSANRELNVGHTGFPFYCSTRYFVGNFDGFDFRVNKGQSRPFDGPDLYAVSVFNNTLIAMINNWKYLMEIPFNGTLSYPRHLGQMTLNNFTYLTQEFIRLDAFNVERFEIEDATNEQMSYSFAANRPHYIKLRLRNLDCENDCDFQLKFEDAANNNTVIIGFTHSTNAFYLDRTKGVPVNTFFNEVHRYHPKYQKLLNDNEFEIDVILDVNTVEVLADRGIVAITALHLNDRIFSSLTLTTNKLYKVDLRISSFGS